MLSFICFVSLPASRWIAQKTTELNTMKLWVKIKNKNFVFFRKKQNKKATYFWFILLLSVCRHRHISYDITLFYNVAINYPWIALYNTGTWTVPCIHQLSNTVAKGNATLFASKFSIATVKDILYIHYKDKRIGPDLLIFEFRCFQSRCHKCIKIQHLAVCLYRYF